MCSYDTCTQYVFLQCVIIGLEQGIFEVIIFIKETRILWIAYRNLNHQDHGDYLTTVFKMLKNGIKVHENLLKIQ